MYGNLDPVRKLQAECLLSTIRGYEELYKETLTIFIDQITHKLNFQAMPFFGEIE